MRIRDFAGGPGIQPTGPLNRITDVPGVTVGHATILGQRATASGPSFACTGVTAVVPHGGNLFRQPVTAAVHVINGFGKAIGTAQIVETGLLETPIILTNTLCAGRAADALISHMLACDPGIGYNSPTVNPVVAECNDGRLNDIRARFVHEEHVLAALAGAGRDFAEGAAGAGTGMISYGWKSGIGSASRQAVAGGDWTLGVLVLANFGSPADLTILGVPVGRHLTPRPLAETGPCAGSVIVVLGTDAPLDARQLGRVARRCEVGLARTGGYHFHGSGDFVLGFAVPRGAPVMVRDSGEWMDDLFRAAADSTEEAVYNALITAESTPGRDGRLAVSLGDHVKELAELFGRFGRPTVQNS